MLQEIRLQNFKNWRNLHLQLAPITLLLGRNGVGKSNILHALTLLKQTADDFERKLHMNLFGGRQGYVDFGGYRELIQQHNEALPLGINLKWRYNNAEHSPLPTTDPLNLSYDVVWMQHNNQINIETLAYEVSTDGDHPLHTAIHLSRQTEHNYRYTLAQDWALHAVADNQPTSQSHKRFTTPPESCYRLPASVLMVDESAGHKAPPIELGLYNWHFEWLMSRIFYLRPIRQLPRRTLQWTDSMPTSIGLEGQHTTAVLIGSQRAGRPLLDEVRGWMVRLGLLDDLKVESVDSAGHFYEVRTTRNGYEDHLADAGFGTVHALALVTLLHKAPPESVVLLEQPDLHMHPEVQARLADLLLSIAEQRKLQLIVETHSEHLITRLQLRIAEIESAYATPENIGMYVCDANAKGSTAERLNIDTYGQIRNWPRRLFGGLGSDIDAMTIAALERHRREIEGG